MKRVPMLVGVTPAVKQVPVVSHCHAEIHHVDCLATPDVAGIAEVARRGFAEWSATAPAQRAEVLHRAAAQVLARRAALVEAHREIGGPAWFAHFNVDGAVAQLRHYAACVAARPHGVVPQLQAALALVCRRPVGPVLAISPWNAPVILATRAMAAPLAAGCLVVHKLSERSPLVLHMLVEALRAAGVPPAALQLVHAAAGDAAAVTEAFLAHRDIRMVNFTGSTASGRAVARAAGHHLKPALLELGGKNCAIVAADADLDVCVPTVLRDSWCHQGQICMAVDRAYVHRSVYESFCRRIAAAAAVEAASPDYAIAPRDELVRRKACRLVEEAVAGGARVLYRGAGGAGGAGPTVLTGVTAEMALDAEESFAPVLAVEPYDDADAVVGAINAAAHGLKASVWGNTLGALALARRLECGGVHLNASCIHDEATVPHGGTKDSGHGRFNGTWGIDLFSYLQTITAN
jgi:acyl-CoA reductase-like NAD-dependent aldehyde dehydrogenase